MTTRQFASPVLDRLLQRETTTTVEVLALMAFAYDALYIGGGDRLDPGTWRRDGDTELRLALLDSAGLSFPTDLMTPLAGVEVAFDGAAATTLSLTALEVVRFGFNLTPASLRLTFGADLPAAGTALTVTFDTGGTQTVTKTATRSVWCARRDFRARDQLQAGDGQFFELSDTRFVVRAQGQAWDVGDTFTFEGESFTVRGVSELLGRLRFTELLARTT